MDLQQVLEDDLILLKPLEEDDFDRLYEVAKDPLIWEQHPVTDRYKKEVYAQFFVESIESKGAYLIIEKPRGEAIGSTRFKKVKRSERAIEIGWSFLSRDKWGGKYNRAAKKLMIDYALQYVDHVIFYIGETNIRSQRAVEKLGGIKITDPNLGHLMREDGSDLTFRIGKDNWTI